MDQKDLIRGMLEQYKTDVLRNYLGYTREDAGRLEGGLPRSKLLEKATEKMYKALVREDVRNVLISAQDAGLLEFVAE